QELGIDFLDVVLAFDALAVRRLPQVGVGVRVDVREDFLLAVLDAERGIDRARPSLGDVSLNVERRDGLLDIHVETGRADHVAARFHRRRAGAEHVERHAARIVVRRIVVDVDATDDLAVLVEDRVDRVLEADAVDVADAALPERRIAVLNVGVPRPLLRKLAGEPRDEARDAWRAVLGAEVAHPLFAKRAPEVEAVDAVVDHRLPDVLWQERVVDADVDVAEAGTAVPGTRAAWVRRERALVPADDGEPLRDGLAVVELERSFERVGEGVSQSGEERGPLERVLRVAARVRHVESVRAAADHVVAEALTVLELSRLTVRQEDRAHERAARDQPAVVDVGAPDVLGIDV